LSQRLLPLTQALQLFCREAAEALSSSLVPSVVTVVLPWWSSPWSWPWCPKAAANDSMTAVASMSSQDRLMPFMMGDDGAAVQVWMRE
jgi:hypothetical protein